MRRKKRVEKKMVFEMQQEEVKNAICLVCGILVCWKALQPPSHSQALRAEEDVSSAEFTMLHFAEKYFNDHPRGGSGTMSIRSKKGS